VSWAAKGWVVVCVADGGRFYCIWDSFRAQHPLLTIIDPAAQTEMVRALIDIYRHEGG
jgi:putative alpha-1,2-mannosidase